MTTDRRDLLLAVLRARGPISEAALAYHPVLAELYDRTPCADAIRADLEALVDAGDAVAWTSRHTGAGLTEAYDVADVERRGWRARYQRALQEYREGRRRHSPARWAD